MARVERLVEMATAASLPCRASPYGNFAQTPCNSTESSAVDALRQLGSAGFQAAQSTSVSHVRPQALTALGKLPFCLVFPAEAAFSVTQTKVADDAFSVPQVAAAPPSV